MKSKTIRKVLKMKLNQWANSITDDRVKGLVKKNTIVTGGAIASMLLKEPVKDYDVYFKDKETTMAVAQYYVAQFNKENPGTEAMVLDGETAGVKEKIAAGFAGNANLTPDRVKIGIKSIGVASAKPDLLSDGPFEDAVEAMSQADSIPQESLDSSIQNYKPVFLSSNAITLSDKLQVVVRFYGEPEEIHKSYDFVHCTNYYDLGKDELVLKPAALESLLSKELIYQGSKYPICSIIRTRKFISRGFTINAGQYLKMCWQVSQLDLTDIEVLEDQLIGVDSAYFSMLISALRDKTEKEPGFQIDGSYIATVIDRIF